ncbi:MAG TPA: hypothetical protein PKE64_31285 [Anaerolineae bacterium]|nr:hypothetical protein [Anaerolineae bacterium]HMR68516.1 hypothetical protein [Anaerolineae bacterium]
MDFVSADMQLMHYIRSDGEFNRAKLKGFWQSLFDLVTRRRSNLLLLSQVVRQMNLENSIDLGVQDIPIEKIVGSVSRSTDFTRTFMPVTNDRASRERWRKIYTLVTLGKATPPIEVYQVGQQFFVVDGHHRVSVARHLGWKSLQAHVTELLIPERMVQAELGGKTMQLLFTHHPTEQNTVPQPDAPMLRLVLYKNEICRLPKLYTEIQAISGNAWVTVNGRDKFLVRGERMMLQSNGDFALVSSLGETPLILEARANKSSDEDLVRLIPQPQTC